LRYNVLRSNSDSLFYPPNIVLTGISIHGFQTGEIVIVNRDGNPLPFSSQTDISAQLRDPLPLSEIASISLGNSTKKDVSATVTLLMRQMGTFVPLDVPINMSSNPGVNKVIGFDHSTQANNNLIAHLQANQSHYSRAIFRSLDSSSLALLLSPYKYRNKPLAQVVDPAPVTITGNYIVFRMHVNPNPNTENEEEIEWEEWLTEHGVDLNKPTINSEMVALPSAGVFAEAVLGRFNSAEKLDVTRFWNWQDSPLPIQAPEIAPIQMGSRGQPEDLKPGQFSQPLVNIVSPTSLPDPTGMAATISAIANGNMFRDMSGLAATIGLAKSGLAAASEGATAAGSQAGANMATAAQFATDLLKTAAAVASLGMGAPALGLGAASSNISNQGAKINHGKSLDQRDAEQSVNGGGSSQPSISNNTPGAAGNISNGNGNNSSSSPGLTTSNEKQAFNQSVWGETGQSKGDLTKDILQSTSFGSLRRSEAGDLPVFFSDFITSGNSQTFHIGLGIHPFYPALMNNSAEIVFQGDSAYNYSKYDAFRIKQQARVRSWQFVQSIWSLIYQETELSDDDPDTQKQVITWNNNRPEFRTYDSPGFAQGNPAKTLNVGDGVFSDEKALQVVVKQYSQTWVEGLTSSGWERISDKLQWISIQWVKRTNPSAKWQKTAGTKIRHGLDTMMEFNTSPTEITL
jgi:hypothetical protein